MARLPIFSSVENVPLRVSLGTLFIEELHNAANDFRLLKYATVEVIFTYFHFLECSFSDSKTYL